MMAAAPVYAHAPIVEAVIDIQVRLGGDADQCLSHLCDTLAEQFPKRDQLHLFSMEMRPDGNSVQRNVIGWRLANTSGDRMLQVKREGFTYSHMSPYTQWAVFSAEAKALWAAFVKCCAPEAVIRIAIRYVNRLKLPPGEVQLNDYLVLFPHTPDAYDPIQGMLMQVQGRHESIDPMCTSIVTLASEPRTDSSFQPLLLDIDVFIEKQISSAGDDCWNLLETLRLKKNELFESAITDKLRESFK
jgi:uncharacterized protein (TIGR04255 family)